MCTSTSYNNELKIYQTSGFGGSGLEDNNNMADLVLLQAILLENDENYVSNSRAERLLLVAMLIGR